MYCQQMSTLECVLCNCKNKINVSALYSKQNVVFGTLICINSSLMVKKPTSGKAATGRHFEDDVWFLFFSTSAHASVFEIGPN